MLKKSITFETLTQLNYVRFLLNTGERFLSYRKCKKIGLKETGSIYDENFVCTDNPGQNI